jgi:hypothetical protein
VAREIIKLQWQERERERERERRGERESLGKKKGCVIAETEQRERDVRYLHI